MKTEKKALKSDVSTREKLADQARQLDRQIRASIKVAERSLSELSALLARMKNLRLWQYLPGGYRRWEDYAEAVLGARSRSTLYEMLAAHMLTEGSHPIPAATVNKIGIKKAAELARLEPSQRTPELVRTAVEQSLPVVRRKVQEQINMQLPADEQREATVLFSINLPESTRDELEELIEVGMWMEGIRDGDRTQSMRQKFFGAMVVATREYYAVEL